MKLGVLDQSPISAGSTGRDALLRSIDLARSTERFGYHRFWVAEHHGTPALACSSPEILISAIARETSTIRVGSGGVMLPHYSPLKVAETFTMLAALHPGRIDLGVGRAAGTDPGTAFALQRDRRRPAPDDFPAQLAELLGYLGDSIPSGHPFARLASILPGKPETPAPWLLGSSTESALWAAEAGLPYAFADFINADGVRAATLYRERFKPSEWLDEPRVIAACWVTCAETEREARDLSASARMLFKLLFRGKLIPVPPVDEALAFLASEPAGPRGGGRRRRNIVGAPSTVLDQLEEVEAEYGADEIMIVTMTWEHEARVRSYELISSESDRRVGQPVSAPPQTSRA